MAKAFALRSSNSGPVFDGNAGDVLSLLSSGKAEFVPPAAVPGAYQVACTPDDLPGYLNSKLNSAPGVFLQLTESTPGNFVITIGAVQTPNFPGEDNAGNVTGAQSVSVASSLTRRFTLTGNATVTVTNLPAGRACWFQFKVIQDGTGSRTLSLVGAKTPSGAGLTLSTAAGAQDIISGYWDGTTIYAQVGGLAFA